MGTHQYRQRASEILNLVADGKAKVYYQPDEKSEMKYPAILYELDQEAKLHADNNPYRTTNRYQVTVIDRDPDSEFPHKISSLPMSTFARRFARDDLNHTIYNVYF